MEQRRDPICVDCKNCLWIAQTGKIRRIDCKKNPNLGGVNVTYSKCCSYEHE